MNNEILELSQWLYDKGFECDYSLAKYSLRASNLELINPKTVKPGEQDCVAYFTLNKALELLPEKIENKDKDAEYDWEEKGYLIISKNYITYRFVYRGEYMGDLLKEPVGCNHHLAALRLLKQVVEKGYLKGENDE